MRSGGEHDPVWEGRRIWSRVFSLRATEPPLAELLALARQTWQNAEIYWRADDLGWFEAHIGQEEDVLLVLARYLTDEEPDVRTKLNTWAAWLETQESVPESTALMQRMISSRQVITLHGDLAETELAQCLCQWLAQITDGVYQIDEQGLFATDGTLLVRERNST